MIFLKLLIWITQSLGGFTSKATSVETLHWHPNAHWHCHMPMERTNNPQQKNKTQLQYTQTATHEEGDTSARAVMLARRVSFEERPEALGFDWCRMGMSWTQSVCVAWFVMVKFLIKRHVSASTLAGVCEHYLPQRWDILHSAMMRRDEVEQHMVKIINGEGLNQITENRPGLICASWELFSFVQMRFKSEYRS